LLTADDLTQAEQLQHLEVEAANLRLIRSMADRLAHEVGNAMVPLSTHQQLLGEKFKDKEFRESLDRAMADSVKRVSRLINQMRFLARGGQLDQDVFAVENLIEDAYQEARKHQPTDSAQLKCENEGKPIVITGDRAALKHALAEIMLNALQANPKAPTIDVHLQTGQNNDGGREVQIEVQDNGTGFTAEAAQKAPAPFYTTRNVGLGQGPTVSQKIIKTHHGKLEIVPPQNGQHGIVRISLPIEPSISTAA
jgi:signal transduction histidine kinase